MIATYCVPVVKTMFDEDDINQQRWIELNRATESDDFSSDYFRRDADYYRRLAAYKQQRREERQRAAAEEERRKVLAVRERIRKRLEKEEAQRQDAINNVRRS